MLNPNLTRTIRFLFTTGIFPGKYNAGRDYDALNSCWLLGCNRPLKEPYRSPSRSLKLALIDPSKNLYRSLIGVLIGTYKGPLKEL